MKKVKQVSVWHLLFELWAVVTHSQNLFLSDVVGVDAQIGHNAKGFASILRVAYETDALSQVDRVVLGVVHWGPVQEKCQALGRGHLIKEAHYADMIPCLLGAAF